MDPASCPGAEVHRSSADVPPTSLGRTAVLAAAALLPLACGDSSTTGPDPDSDGAATVRITPSEADLDALGAMLDFSGRANDATGTDISEAELTWSSTVDSVATVNDGGVAEARANGTTRIVASFGTVADTAMLTVDQRASRVTVTPATDTLRSSGTTAPFTVSGEDTNGHPVPDASFTWSSLDTAVASVDQDGLATARAHGVARIVALEEEGTADTAELAVVLEGAPEIDSVEPDTLVEGARATIRGRHFSLSAASNEVSIDGVEADVISATSTELRVTVPRFDCLPPRRVRVRVSVAGLSSEPDSSAMRSDDAPLSLAVGEHAVIQDPSEFCLLFAETLVPESYLMGVQSVTEILGTTPVRVTSVAGAAPGSLDGGRMLSPLARRGRRPASARRRTAYGRSALRPRDERARRWRRHFRAESELRRWEYAHIAPRIEQSLPRRTRPRTPSLASASIPPTAGEGDVFGMRVPDITGNPCSDFLAVDVEVREVGSRVILVEDTANPSSGGFTDADYESLAARFDSDTWTTHTDYFGTPGDVDGNDRLVVVITKELNEFGGILGFVFSGDLLPRSGADGCASSDEGEVTYTLAPDPAGAHGDDVSVQELRETYPRLLAHEYTHVIQQGIRFACSACEFMPPWVAEGQAVVGEEVAGHAVEGRAPRQDYGHDVAFDPDDSDVSRWYRNRFVDMAVYFGFSNEGRVAGAPEACSWQVRSWNGPCVGSRAVYGVPSSLYRWFMDHLGPTYPGGERGMMRDMTASTVTGFDNLEALTGETMEDLLAEWAPMLYLDGRAVSGLSPRLTLPSWDVADIFTSLPPEARLVPRQRGFSDFTDGLDVNAGSTAYYELSGSLRPAVALRVRGIVDQTLGSYMQVWIVRTR